MRIGRHLLILLPTSVIAVTAITPTVGSAGSSPHMDGTTTAASRTPASTLEASYTPVTTMTRLNAVAAVPGSSILWAVGSVYNSETNSTDTIIQRYDGVKWRLAKSLNANFGRNELNGVAAVSLEDVWAVGSTSGESEEQTLIEHYDGTSWRLTPSPSPEGGYARLTAVAAISATDVWAVGYKETDFGEAPLVEHWDGMSWTEIETPSSGSSRFRGVAALAPNDVWAVGEADDSDVTLTLIEHYDGTQWSVVPSPNPGEYSNALKGVVALSRADVWAVGDLFGPSGRQPLLEHFDGASWIQVPGPSGSEALLTGIAGTSPTDLWASGFHFITEGTTSTEVEHFDGSTWSTLPTPDPGSLSNSLNGIAIGSSGTVWSVGGSRQTSDMENSLIEADDGAGWKAIASPNVRGDMLRAVSAISVTDAWAVGSAIDPRTGGGRTLAEHWNGTEWSIVETPTAGVSAVLAGVTALSASDAWAVGSYMVEDQTLTPLAGRFDGTKWRPVAVPNPGNAYLAAVAAVTPEDVWAVGSSYDAYLRSSTLIEHWDGSSWSVIPSPNPGSPNSRLTGLSVVSSDDVWAVGESDAGGPYGGKTLTEHWDGTSWTVVPSPNPGRTANRLLAVVAFSPNNVYAVGTRTDFSISGFHSGALAEHFNGTKWSVSPTPNFATENELDAVGGASSSQVWAVGGLFDEQGDESTLIERRSGSGWIQVPSPSPAERANRLMGIAAPATDQVWAVGYGLRVATGSLTLIEVFDGTRWRVVRSPNK